VQPLNSHDEEIMKNPTESHTVHFTKEDRPLFDQFKLQLDKAHLTRLREQEKKWTSPRPRVAPKARPDFGMTVPPVVDRRIRPRNRSEREWPHRKPKTQESHLGAVAA
jgi:hypothetical protein